MTLDTNTPQSAVDALTAFVETERRERGLEEFHLCPGSDREGNIEDTAKVALAMLKYRQSLRDS